MTYDRLISYLNGWGTSAARAEDGTIRVEYVHHRGQSRVVHVVMSPSQWDVIAGTIWGDFDSAVEHAVLPALLSLERERFLVFDHVEPLPSVTPELDDRPRAA